MLIGIKIEKLFDIFDYDIEFKREGITILTGPNGYGKTTVLKILDALASQNGFFFVRLLFKKIVLEFSDKNTITLDKKNSDEVLITNSNLKKTMCFNNNSLEKILRDLPFDRKDENSWIDHLTGEIYDTRRLLSKVIHKFPEFAEELHQFGLSEILKQMPAVYFIREQRLLRPVPDTRRNYEFNQYGERAEFINTIEEYAKEFSDNITKETFARELAQVSQELDSSFPRRLFEQKQDISEDEFNQRFDIVKKTQRKLNEYGLANIKEDNHPTYKKEISKALHVYINDAEKKLSIFSELLKKLEIFTHTLNESRLTFKYIAISKENGFKFFTDKGKPLATSDLSSGEQQEVVLLYELLFKVKAGTLVLIDEPELSLHVVWQKQFLDDLFKIIELQKISIVVATHSPQIINNHWDLTVDLEELRDAAISK